MKSKNKKDEITMDDSQSENDEYQSLSNNEELDLEKLMKDCEFTIDNAQEFTEKLSKESALMDAQNIEKIMASEKAVENLMQVLQNSIDETINLEKKIDNYLSLLKNNDIVQQVNVEENQVKLEQENKLKLENYLKNLVNQLDFPKHYEDALLNNDLNSKSGIKNCQEAAFKLQDYLNANLHSSINCLISVQEQKKYLDSLQIKFSQRLSLHINIQFKHFKELYKSQNQNFRDFNLPKHDLIHDGLSSYQVLVRWLFNNNQEVFLNLIECYEQIMKIIYDEEILFFFTEAKQKIAHDKEPKKYNFNDNDTISSKGSGASMSEWDEFDQSLNCILNSIDPVCSSEQEFCIKFFNLDLNFDNRKSKKSDPSISSNLNRRVSNVSANNSILNSYSNESQTSSEINQEKKIKNSRELMSCLFESLEPEFLKFVSHYDKIDGLYSLYLFARLTQHVLNAEDTSSFLAQTYGRLLIHVKRNFDKFMANLSKDIESSKITKKPKCGIFPFIKKFEIIAKQIETVYKNSKARRADIDKWYKILVNKILEEITNLAKQHHKTPEEMVLLENYHYLHDVLMTLKIECLEEEKKETKLRYSNALKSYVSKYFGRPLEKLNKFFAGVQQKLSQGLDYNEVNFQSAYSKQELRKIIDEISLKEVKKGLEEMYRKVGKHISDPDSALIQVIWRSMQEEFIIQYKSIDALIQRCYPDANIRLLFTIDDLLRVFSSIAYQR